jgi:hypothetical protein
MLDFFLLSACLQRFGPDGTMHRCAERHG